MATPLDELTETHSKLTDEIIATPKDNPNKKILRGLRTKLEDQMEEIERSNADRTTKVFIDANKSLLEVNKKVQKALNDLDSMKAKIDAVKGLISAVTDFLKIIP